MNVASCQYIPLENEYILHLLVNIYFTGKVSTTAFLMWMDWQITVFQKNS